MSSLLAILMLALVYFISAKLSLSLAFVAEQVSAVWPPTGIALSAVLLLGYRVWPGIALGAFLVNALTNEPIGTACGIAVGNTLEALTGAFLFRRLAGSDNSLGSLKEVLGIVVLAAGLSTMVSATIGVASLCLGGVTIPNLQRTITWADFPSLWWVWWLGDALGALIVAPVLLTLASSRRPWPRGRGAECLALAVGLVAIAGLVFGRQITAGAGEESLVYSIFPFVIWAALRFGQQGTAVAVLVASCVAVWSTVDGRGPFGNGPAHERLLLLGSFLAVVAVTGLILAASLTERQRAEAEAWQQREWLRVTLRSIGDAVIASDSRGRITFINPVAEHLTGWGQDAVGQPLADVLRIVDEAGQPIVSNLSSWNLSDFEVAQRALLRAKNSKELPIEDAAAQILDAQGQVTGTVVVFRDITNRQRDERRLAMLHAATRLLASSVTLAEAAPRIIQVICENLSWQFGAIWTLDQESQTLRCLEAWHEPPRPYPVFDATTRQTTFARGVGLPGRVWDSGAAAWIPDVVEDENFPRASVAAIEGLHAAFGLPIRHGKELLGVIEFFSAEVRQPDEDLLRMIATVGAQVGQFIARRRDEEALRQSEEMLRLALAAGRMGTWDWNVQTNRVAWSPSLEAIHGLAPGSFAGTFEAYLRDVHPDDRQMVARVIAESVVRGTNHVVEYRLLWSSGEIRWVEGRGQLWHDEAGRPSRMVGVCLDITERKRAEAAIRDSEERYRSLVEFNPEAVFAFSGDQIAFANPAAARLLGAANPDQLLGKSAWEVIHADFHRVFQERVEWVLKSGSSSTPVEQSWLRLDGRPVEVEVVSHRCSWPTGPGVEVIARDVTQRKRAVEALRESEERSRSIVDHVIDGIITIDERGTIRSFNPAAEKLFEYRAAEVIGQNVKLLMPPPYHDEHDGYLANYLRTGQAKIIGVGREVVGRRKGGSMFPMDLAVSEFHLGEGRFFTGIVRDITERMRLLEQLQQRAEQLAEADRRKNEFLAMLAHELRNPLAPIRNASHMLTLLQGPLDPDLQWARDVIERQVQQMTRMVDDLLDVSRITRGKVNLKKELVDVATLVTRAVEMSQSLINRRKHALQVVLPPVPLTLKADPARLAQVLANLLDNAAKYTEEGGRIDLRVECQEQSVQITVRDTGIGIPANFLPQVFELFSQEDRSLERTHGGLGIGLTLVRNLVEMHGGAVRVFSEGPGAGSEFTVTLPLAMETISTPVPSTSEPAIAAPTGGRRILVVDDNHDAAQTLAKLLRLTGHEVLTAHDGPTALDVARIHEPEVALLDIGLPGMDGLEVARRLRQELGLKNTLLIALTGYGQEEDRRRSRLAGFSAHLIKPVDLDALGQLIAQGPPHECDDSDGPSPKESH